MQNKISTYDYYISLKKLGIIGQEEIKYYMILNNNNIPCKNRNQIFSNYIILLTKRNKNYHKIIENKTKNFLNNYKYNPKLHDLFKEKIDFIIYYLINKSPEDDNFKLDSETELILNTNNYFKILIDDIKRLIEKTQKNNLEIEYLNCLIKEKEHCLTIKQEFQNSKKNYKPNTKKKRKNKN